MAGGVSGQPENPPGYATGSTTVIRVSSIESVAELIIILIRFTVGPLVSMSVYGQFRGDGRTVRTLVFGVYKICCITGSVSVTF